MSKDADQTVAWQVAAGIVATAFIAGAMRYWMRELMNGVSRRIEYDLRNDLVRTPRNARRLVLRAHAHRRHHGAPDERPERRAHGRRSGDHVSREHDLRRAVRARVHAADRSCGSRLLALLPMIAAADRSRSSWAARSIARFEAVQEQFSTLTTRAQENLDRRANRPRVPSGSAPRSSASARSTRSTSRSNMSLVAAVRHDESDCSACSPVSARWWCSGRRRARRSAARSPSARSSRSALYLGMLTWPLIALGWVINLFQRGAASMARLARDTRRECQRSARRSSRRSFAPGAGGPLDRIPRRRISLPRPGRSGAALGAAQRELRACRPARHWASSARRGAARAR